MSASRLTLWCALFLAGLCSTRVTGDVNSGCPNWGCLSWGNFAFSTGIPASNGQVKWSTVIESTTVVPADGALPARGCISNQDFVVCTTRTGYVSMDPSTGEVLWKYVNMTNPYIPLMDIYGDVIGMDRAELLYVGNDGTPKRPIHILPINPKFGVMVSNNSILLLTASQPETAQIFTYDTDGIIDASFELRGNMENMNGTHIPCSHPIIHGKRAYIVTCFTPNNTAVKSTGFKKLFAIDLLNQMAPRVAVAWSTTFMPLNHFSQSRDHLEPPLEHMAPVVTYYNNTVYVNMADRRPGSGSNSTIFAFRDHGDTATKLFQAPGVYGAMAVYDTYEEPKQKDPADLQCVWVASSYPAKLIARSTMDGSIRQIIDIGNLTKLHNVTITSKLGITREKKDLAFDVLVVGVMDGNHQAYLVALQADPRVPRLQLLWSVQLSDPTVKDAVWRVEGQIVNTAQPVPDKKTLMRGVIAMVSETGANYTKTHAKGVF